MSFVKTLPALALLIPLAAMAQPGPGGHRGPPPEAIDACVSLEESDTCTFQHRDTSVDGVCMPGPRPELPLACRPEAPHEEGRRRGPPPEAIEACVDLEIEAICGFEHRGQLMEGACAAGPRDELPLACKPARRD